jgi:uncharacterized protein (TIGR02284 family)
MNTSMNSPSSHEIAVLNDLITTTLDSAKGYDEAAKDAQNPTFKTLFARWAEERRQTASDLQREVRALGGKPGSNGSMLGSAHRIFLSVRDALSKGDKSVVEEVERGEDFIKDKFELAMTDDELSSAVRPVVAGAYDSVARGYAQARDLKQRYRDA